MTPWVKICGATRPADIDLLAAAGVDLVGLWHGVPGGHAELGIGALAALAHAAASAGLTPVLVTVQATAAAIRPVLLAARLGWVQLHGYQPPGTVRALKAADGDLRVIKVLHLRGGECPERSLIGAYQRAGQLREVSDHPRFRGIDVDTGARGRDGRLDPRRVAELRQAWPTSLELAAQ